jgi:hypothetical protein
LIIFINIPPTSNKILAHIQAFQSCPAVPSCVIWNGGTVPDQAVIYQTTPTDPTNSIKFVIPIFPIIRSNPHFDLGLSNFHARLVPIRTIPRIKNNTEKNAPIIHKNPEKAIPNDIDMSIQPTIKTIIEKLGLFTIIRSLSYYVLNEPTMNTKKKISNVPTIEQNPISDSVQTWGHFEPLSN